MTNELNTLRTENARLRREGDGVAAIAVERRRQVEAEGWSPEHDNQHTQSELADAALSYLQGSMWTWPSTWAREWWKPKDRRSNLVRAGALIAAEIDRLDRRTAPPPTEAHKEGSETLRPEDVEWVVNDLAELGVKIGDQFFFLYKGESLVYGYLDPDPTVPPVHEGCGEFSEGTPLRWRRVHKREFGECAHPINHSDYSKIGTVSVDDGQDWQPIPAALSTKA